jgi:hypothetical protein
MVRNNGDRLFHGKAPCQMSAYKSSLLLLRLEGRRVSLLHHVTKVELSGNIYIGIKINWPPRTEKRHSFMQFGKWIENVGTKQKNYRSYKSKCKTNVFSANCLVNSKADYDVSENFSSSMIKK